MSLSSGLWLTWLGDPTSAGQQYHDLFKRLVDPDHSNNLYELLGYFYASQFHCVNNVPRPLAHVYFSIAFARCIDAGLHRYVFGMGREGQRS